MKKIRGGRRVTQCGDPQCHTVTQSHSGGTHSVVNFELPPVAEAQRRPGENNHHVHEEDVLHEDDCHPGPKEII